jgi:hypothetical protein
MVKKETFKEMEEEVKEQLGEKGNFKEVVAKTYPVNKSIVDLMKELKTDPEFRPYLVPIPDYGAVNCLISMKILKTLEKLNEKS